MEALSDDEREVIEQNIGLVWGVDRRWNRTSLPLMDRVQAGADGLIMSIRRYDPEHGTWSNFATWGVESYLRRATSRAAVAQGRPVRIPRR